MRFADAAGQYVDVYQVPTHFVNESDMTYPAAIATQLDRAVGPEGYYGAFGTHYDFRGDNFETMLLQASQSRDIPLVSGKMLLDWTDARNASYITNQIVTGDTFRFTANVDSRARSMMRAMVPYSTAQGQLTAITRDGGTPVNFVTETIKGVLYAFMPVTNGTYTATYAPDVVAPAVISVAPANGQTAVPTSSDLTVQFSEPVDPSTVTAASFQLLDIANTPLAATVTYDVANRTATLNPDTVLLGETTYTIRINGAGSANPVRDVAGNALSATYTSTFITATQQISLWAPTVPATTVATGDTADVELGLRFTTSQAGKITGITFYKGYDDGLTHTLSLYDGAGAVIATANTANETPTGWQTAYFATPIDVQTGITYTATYRMTTGRYVFTHTNLATAFTNSPLTAQANGGVYRYGGGYPTSSFNGSNYWVDVIYTL